MSENHLNWLPLTEYSIKHQVSISTLRRRIKAEDIQFRLDDGKYFILDDGAPPAEFEPVEHRPSLNRGDQQKMNLNILQNNNQDASASNSTENSESVLTAANRLLTDLKKAYTQVLHEKENQIQDLKKEISDIKTLVKVLEFENEKLRNYNR